MHFNCDFHPCALTKRTSGGTNPPLVCCQRCLYQFVYGSEPWSLYFDCRRVRIDRISADTFSQLPPGNSIPLQSCGPAMVMRYPLHRRELYLLYPTFQLVELDVGWCKPAQPQQRWIYYGTIIMVWQPRSRVEMHKSPSLKTVTARK